MTALSWIKSVKNDWLYFQAFPNLSEIRTAGVYIIWHGGEKPGTVRVGKGDICERLTAHRKVPSGMWLEFCAARSPAT
jgi:hypothetical protein